MTQVDYFNRAHAPPADKNPQYCHPLSCCAQSGACAVPVNKRFNLRRALIVTNPEDIPRRFMGSNPDFLAVVRCIIRKADRKPTLASKDGKPFEQDWGAVKSSLSRKLQKVVMRRLVLRHRTEVIASCSCSIGRLWLVHGFHDESSNRYGPRRIFSGAQQRAGSRNGSGPCAGSRREN